jgi:siroheme synthase (precorrin-2 oxidase/ferrochelatase)
MLKRGVLQIAISTGGESPALAHRLRKELEAQFGPEYEDWLAELAVRHEIEVRNQPHFFAGHPQLGIGARTASLWRNLPRARMPSIADCNEGKEESQAGRCPRTPRGEIFNRRPRRGPRRD